MNVILAHRYIALPLSYLILFSYFILFYIHNYEFSLQIASRFTAKLFLQNMRYWLVQPIDLSREPAFLFIVLYIVTLWLQWKIIIKYWDYYFERFYTYSHFHCISSQCRHNFCSFLILILFVFPSLSPFLRKIIKWHFFVNLPFPHPG